MKPKIFSILLFAIFFVGCGEPRTPELYARSTVPIFITNGDVKKASRLYAKHGPKERRYSDNGRFCELAAL